MACFYKAAEMGNVFAQLYLAEKLYHFASSSRDQEEGIRWYRLAAEQGHPDAIVQMEKIESQGHIS